MTPSKKGESALGKGLDALIRKEKPDEPVSKKKSVKRKVSKKDSTKEKPTTKKVKKLMKIQIKSSLRE